MPLTTRLDRSGPTAGFEYAVEILTLGQVYRDRADCENTFDELKNQWGWGGFTTHDLKRCRLLARSVALLRYDLPVPKGFVKDRPFSMLLAPVAWMPPLLAAMLCGLQLSFWEHATAASGDEHRK